MNTRAVTHLITYLVGITALTMICAAGISFYYGESAAAKGLLIAAAVAIGFSATAWYLTGAILIFRSGTASA